MAYTMIYSKLSQASKLKQHSHDLAQVITDLHFKRRQDLEQQLGNKSEKKYHDDVIDHINYLEQAVRVNSSALFSDHLDWSRTMLKERGIPENELINTIRYLKKAIRLELPDDMAQSLAEFVDTGLESLQNHPSGDKTFLKSGEPLAEKAKNYPTKWPPMYWPISCKQNTTMCERFILKTSASHSQSTGSIQHVVGRVGTSAERRIGERKLHYRH